MQILRQNYESCTRRSYNINTPVHHLLHNKPGPNLHENLMIYPKIVLRYGLSLSYDFDLRSAKIILRFS